MSEQLKRKRDWEGRWVKLRHPIRNRGGWEFPAGMLMRVDRSHGGLHLEVTRECPCCRIRRTVGVRKVSEDEVVLMPRDFEPPPHEWPDEAWPAGEGIGLAV